MIETLPGGEEIILHDFSADSFCGRCGKKMGEHKDGVRCTVCHLMYSQPRRPLL